MSTLLRELDVTTADIDTQRQAVDDWLTDHQPSAVLEAGLRARGWTSMQ